MMRIFYRILLSGFAICALASSANAQNPYECARECRHNFERSVEECDRQSNDVLRDVNRRDQQDIMRNLTDALTGSPTQNFNPLGTFSEQNYQSSQDRMDLSGVTLSCTRAAKSEHGRCMEICGFRR